MGVVLYMRSVIKHAHWQGSAISLGMGFLDLFIIAALAWEGYLDMAIAFIFGEAVASWFVIRGKPSKAIRPTRKEEK